MLLDGKPGREFVISMGEIILRARAALVQQRLYQLHYMTPAGQKAQAAARQEKRAVGFFDSFKITRPPPPLSAPANNP